MRLSGHCMEFWSGHVWTKFHIAWWKAVLGHGYALHLCQQWRQREGLTAFDSWNPGLSRVLTSSECQRYLCKAACKYVKVLQYSAHRFFCLRIDTGRKTCSGIRGVMPRSMLPFQLPTLRSYASQSLREDQELLVGWWQRHFFRHCCYFLRVFAWLKCSFCFRR